MSNVMPLMPLMHIASIPASDLDALLALYRQLNPADSPLPDRAVVESTWQELLTSPHYKHFGAYVANELVSSCTLAVIPNLTRSCRPYGLIENVVTHEQHRNKGYGKAVLAHTLSFAWSRQCYKVMLLTGRKDEAVNRFYESAGFDRNEKQAFVARPAA
jgi:GNAT superfamily N-acetyltransferase